MYGHLSRTVVVLLAVVAVGGSSQAQGLLGDAHFGPGPGLIQPSDVEFDNFISPMTNPVFFEDPRNLTEARFIFANHRVPGSLGGGDIQVVAVQLRAALTEDLSFIATKDGYIFSDNPLVNDGWGDVAVGLKYNLFEDAAFQEIVSAGVTYELPVGSLQALQGNGEGEFNLFISGGVEFLPEWHYLSASGFRLPVDRAAESSVWYWSHHVDRQLGQSGFYLFGEANWYHWLGSGSAFTLAPVEGIDLFNLGSVGVSGNDIVTAAFGGKYKPSAGLELGLAYELPVTDRQDVMRDRLTFDCILRY